MGFLPSLIDMPVGMPLVFYHAWWLHNRDAEKDRKQWQGSAKVAPPDDWNDAGKLFAASIELQHAFSL